MKTILIVDDSQAQLKLVKDYLKSPYLKIVTATDGTKGLGITRIIKPDLIITDLVMPELGGLELCRLLKRDLELAQIPIIVCSSKNRDIDRKWSFKQGAAAYVVKPFTQEEIRLAVNKFINIEQKVAIIN